MAVILGISSQQRDEIGNGGRPIVPYRPLNLKKCAVPGARAQSGEANQAARGGWEGRCHACSAR
eukprot:4276765-Alexandrium_andersonii.AAC.1